MIVEDVSRGIVVVGIVHASANGGVVISQHGGTGEVSYRGAALVGVRPVADDVAQAKIFIAWVFVVEVYDCFECVVVAVYI